MKLVLTFSLILMSIWANAQISLDSLNISKPFSDVQAIYNNTNSKENKHLNAKEWFAKTYGDYKSILQFEDDVNCKIIIKGVNALPVQEDAIVSAYMTRKITPFLKYTITIDSRDEKFRIKMEDISIESTVQNIILGKPGSPSKKNESIIEFCTYNSDNILENNVIKTQNIVDSLNAISISNMSKREILDLNKEIANANKELENAKVYRDNRINNYRERQIYIISIIHNIFNSLSDAVKASDDF